MKRRGFVAGVLAPLIPGWALFKRKESKIQYMMETGATRMNDGVVMLEVGVPDRYCITTGPHHVQNYTFFVTKDKPNQLKYIKKERGWAIEQEYHESLIAAWRYDEEQPG